MTTDEELEEASAHQGRWRLLRTAEERAEWHLNGRSTEWFLNARLETPGRRSRLVEVLADQAQKQIAKVQDRRKVNERGAKPEGVQLSVIIRTMERLREALDGTETSDVGEFLSRLNEAHTLVAELRIFNGR